MPMFDGLEIIEEVLNDGRFFRYEEPWVVGEVIAGSIESWMQVKRSINRARYDQHDQHPDQSPLHHQGGNQVKDYTRIDKRFGLGVE